MAVTKAVKNTGKLPSPPRRDKSFGSMMRSFRDWIFTNKIYIFAFIIPFVMMLIAYALFDAYPFGSGENSVLVLDFNAQYVYYFEALRDAFWGDGSIFYNWCRNLSGNYMGIIGYYLASPFTLIVMLLPRTMILGSLMIMQLTKLGAAGVTFCYFIQKSKGVKPFHALIFSNMYALMAYAVIQLMDPMWIDGLVFLPLICLGVEYIVDCKGIRRLNYIIPLALMFIANFYIGYMLGFFTAIYFVYYLFFGKKTELKRAYDYAAVIGRFAYCTVISVMCAAAMILPVYYALNQGKFEFTTPDYSFQLQFTLFDFLPKLLPSTYDTVRNEGLPEVYCGTLTILMIPLFYLNSKISVKQKIGMSFLAAVMLFSMYIKPLDMLWHGGQVPNWLPYRYSFIFSFVILIMAAQAFRHLDGISKKAIGGTAIAVVGFLIYIDKLAYENVDTVGTIWMAVVVIAAGGMLISAIKDHPTSKILPFMLMLVVCCELTSDALANLKDIDKDVAYSNHDMYYEFMNENRSVVDLMEEKDSSLYRADKTYARCKNDSIGMGLRGLTHSSSVMNTKILNFLGSLGYNMRSYYSGYSGATPISDSLLGIKYVLDKDNDVSELYNPLWEYNDITVYQNPDALSMGYMVDDDIKNLYDLSSDNPFENQNTLLSTLNGTMTTDSVGNSVPEDYFKSLDFTGPILTNVTASPYGAQTKYEATADGGDSTVEYHFTAQSDDPVYVFLYTSSEKQVNAWVSTTQNQDGDFVLGSFDFLGPYFETQYYCILKVGQFTAGQEVAFRLTVKDEYSIFQDPYLYYLDTDIYQEGIDALKSNQWEITDDWKETKLTGKIIAEEGQVMMTSIPYEEGWTVKVDGKKAKKIELANAMLGVELSPGEHEVTMTYLPQGWTPGVILVFVGVGLLVLMGLSEKKKKRSMPKAVVINKTEE